MIKCTYDATTWHRSERPRLGNSVGRVPQAKHKKTPMQIVLKWTIQHGVAVVPRSASKEHIIENLQLFDFTLDDADMEAIDGLDENHPCETAAPPTCSVFHVLSEWLTRIDVGRRYYWDPRPSTLVGSVY